MILGAHCSTSGGVHKALERAKAISGDCVQLFVKNNMQWLGKPLTAQALREWERAKTEHKLDRIFGHAGYLINLAAPRSANRDKSLQSLLLEVQLATDLGLPFLVLHPGAHLGSGESAGIKQVIAGLDEVFEASKKSRVRIALENTAGQGTCLGARIAHLAAVFDGVKKPSRLGVCLDTAHFFAAGYDIRSPKGWNAAIKEVDSLVGIKQILAFHLNDSKTDLGSRVDRHAHIGAGKIGLEGFRTIVNDQRFASHPGCLETPKSDDLHEDIMNLQVLRSLEKSRRKV